MDQHVCMCCRVSREQVDLPVTLWLVCVRTHRAGAQLSVLFPSHGEHMQGDEAEQLSPRLESGLKLPGLQPARAQREEQQITPGLSENSPRIRSDSKISPWSYLGH